MPDRFDPPGSRSWSWRWPLAAAIAVVTILGGLATRQYFLFVGVSDRVDQTYDVLETIDVVVDRLVDAETGYRGYLLTANRDFLRPYAGAATDVTAGLARLQTLVVDNPTRTRALGELSVLARQKFEEMGAVLRQFDGGDRDGAVARLNDGLGKRVMDDIRARATEMRESEESLLDIRARQARLARRGATAYGASTVVVVTLLAVLGVLLTRQFERRRLALADETVARVRAEADARVQAAELRRSEDFNRSILDNTGDCVAVLELDGRLVLMNTPGVRLMQLPEAGDWQHEPWPAIWGPHRAVAESALAKAAAGREARFTAERVVPSGGTQWWDVVVTAVKDEHGAPTRLAVICHDVSEHKRAEEERAQLLASERAARSEAERAARLKDDFVATLSHELRTPLNAILGWVGVLRRDQRPETLATAIDVIDRNSRRQSQMIDDLLDIGRIISGKLRLDVQRLDLAAVIEEALTSAQPAADAKGVRLIQVLGSAALIEGDPGRLQQVVWNLVSNAIKFTPKGGQVQVTLRKVQSQVELSVSDTGVGIDPDLLPHVFQRFRQGDPAAAGRQSGLGLGLAITRNLVEMHGGVVTAASDGEGRGSTFTVRLPLALSHRHDGVSRQPTMPAQLAGLLRGLRVLVLDDEPDARDILRRLLEDAGAQVLVTASAQQALDVLQTSLPDVIVSDIGMPDQDGYEFIQQVRQLPGPAATVPAAALTALARLEDRKRALLAGFQSHLAKPVDPAELIAAVGSLTGRTGRALSV
ncbi:MAG: CHASE3 domain-containing protein [Vicinamibacterales bacterium]